MGEAKQAPPRISFFPVISKNVGITLQNFLTFTFNSFVTLVQNLNTMPTAGSKLLNLNQDRASKKLFLLVKSL